MPEKTVQKEPGKKPAPSKKPKPQQEVVVQIPLSELHPFPDHPFQVREDASMQETAESVKEYGVLVPALARPREDGGYELIAGHRRKHACELAGLATMPVIVRDIDRDAATIIMVDSNLQRENILPSERAKAYKMKMEAIKRQGARTDLTSPKISAKFRSDDEVGQDAGVSGDTIRNYIALTQLVPELQQMVDEKKIALSPAYQIAALTPKEQGLLLETIDSEQATPSLSQAQRMKKLSQSGELNEDTMLSIIQLKFRVTPQEREMIEMKMAQFGTTNMAAYLRKMAIDGYVVKLNLPELRELVSLLRYSSNNLNQLTRRAHETGRIYEADLEDIQQSQERIWTAAEKIVSSLAALK